MLNTNCATAVHYTVTQHFLANDVKHWKCVLVTTRLAPDDERSEALK
jgi:hypothetical protein